ncbi:ion channel DMI1, partial [Candidatus Poribacteria bacterium]|nr:ion channel DMI1 [Candidatus Poribacteria bacterium]
MLDRLKNRLKFQIEQLLLRGAHSRLLFIASLVGLVAVGGGLLVQATDAPFDGNETAIWWAFLRLTDPGYLGDDEGAARRVISTVLTVLGYILFMGSLIAIMTQWLNQKIRNFESGLTPIVRRNHILILGWTNRTPAIVEELMRSEERVRRFLERLGARGLHVVILSEDVSLERTMELRSALGSLWDARKITFRSGIPLRMEHLERVDFRNASAIILPGADFAYGGANESDTLILKTVLSIASQEEADETQSLPLLVTEIFDPTKILMAQKAYRGILEILATDVFITRCMAQNVRHPGLSYLFHEILSHRQGNSIYIRTFESFTGDRFWDLVGACPKAILLGVVRPDGEGFRSMLNPADDLTLAANDRLVFLAREYEDCEILKNLLPKRSLPQPRAQSQPVSYIQIESKRRILILGWNHKVTALIEELDDYLLEQFEISTLSLKPAVERETELVQQGIDQDRVTVSHYEGDHTILSDLEAIQPSSYDNVLILGSDWLETQEESDARTIVGHLV